ncbi:MAG: ATP-binding protein [Woeseia sp.]
MDERPSTASTINTGHLRPDFRSTKPALLLLVTILAVATVETLRQRGVAVPAPFLLIYGAAGIASALSGLRVAITVAAIIACYTLYSASASFGPPAIISTTAGVATAIILATLLFAALGYEHDYRRRLLQKLRRKEIELQAAQARLTDSVTIKTAQLQRTRNELDHAHFQLEEAIRNAPVGVISIGQTQRLSYVNAAALALLGTNALPASVRDWRGLIKSIQIIDTNGERMSPDDGPVNQAMQTAERRQDFEYEITGFDGQARWCSGYVGPVQDSEGKTTGAIVMLVDTTEQKSSEIALQKLTELLFNVQEEERGKLARKLHEQIGQSLAVIKMNLHQASSRNGPESGIAPSMELVDQLTDSVRQMSLELRPTALDDFGLRTALDSHLRQMIKPAGVECRLVSSGELATLSEQTTTAANRIVHEAVDNALQHAGASLIEVRVSTNDKMLRLDVVDNGSGFNAAQNNEPITRIDQLGLLFMRERAKQRGGTLDIESSKYAGTHICAELPL